MYGSEQFTGEESMTAIVPTDHNVEINGLNIHYLDWGGLSNRNLLLAHGQGGNAHNWDHIARALREEFRVISVDQRGHGDSSHTWEGYGVADFGRDLAVFVEKIGIAPCDYVGASLGARNGIAYAGDHSDHLKHFVCLDYGPEMSAASARNQISGMNRRLLGYRSIEEYVELQMQGQSEGGGGLLSQPGGARPASQLCRKVCRQVGPGYVLDKRQLRRERSPLSMGAVGQDHLPDHGDEGRRERLPLRTKSRLG